MNSDPGIDPINIKNAYFDWIKAHDPTSSFGKLLQLAKDNHQSLADIVPKVNGSADDMKFLARSIVLLWYLGSWYKPDDLKNKVAKPQVVSAEGLHAGIGLANRWRPPDGLQQFAVRLLVARSARSE